MTVDYPLLQWRSWVRMELKNPSKDEDQGENLTTKQSIVRDTLKQDDAKDTFVLFVRLPSWENAPKKNDQTSPRRLPEIRTLRNLKNGIEAFHVKAALELSTGLPAHITMLYNVKNKRIPDDTRLILGENVSSGCSFSLQVIGAWEDSVKSAWTGNLPDFLHHFPSFYTKNERKLSAAWHEFASTIEKSGKENAFCALFAAASRGNTSVCKAVLKCGADANQTTLFGNSSLHCAAFSGHLEIIQLLVACGANIRWRNIHGKSALDLAVASGFIDCARWLWLNQWSISITKSTEGPSHSPSSNNKSSSYLQEENFAASKPLKDCRTLFTKSESLELPHEVEKPLRPHSGSGYKNSVLQHLTTTSKQNTRPQSSPSAWQSGKEEKSTVKLLQQRHNYNAESSVQPLKTLQRPHTAKVRKTYSSPPTLQPSVVPKLLPQLATSLTRERSIPSIHESRSQSHTYAHLCVDVKPNDINKPMNINMTLNRQWINPAQSFVPHRFSRVPTKMADTGPKSETREENVNYEKVVENFINLKNENEKIIHRVQKPTPTTDKSPSYSSNLLDKHETLRSGSNITDNSSSVKTSKPDTSSIAISKHIAQSKQHQTVSRINEFAKVPPKVETPLPATNNHSTRGGRSSPEKNVSQPSEVELTREEMLRRERNKTAWRDWMTAKHHEEKLAQKRAEEAKQQERAVRKWGITFEQWLERKHDDIDMKSAMDEANKAATRRTHTVTSGKTFELWVKEKMKEKAKENSSHKNHVLSDEEQQKLAELRERNFSAWSSKKLDEAKKEREKIEMTERQKQENTQQLYEEWKSKERVMSFEKWKKGKEKAKRLNSVEDEHKEAQLYVKSWITHDRRKLADMEYRKWLLRKQSLQLEEAEKELNEAKVLREKAERKTKINRAVLRAKAMLRLQEFSKSNPPLTSSQSAGNLADGASNKRENIDHIDEGFSETYEVVSENEAKQNIQTVQLHYRYIANVTKQTVQTHQPNTGANLIALNAEENDEKVQKLSKKSGGDKNPTMSTSSSNIQGKKPKRTRRRKRVQSETDMKKISIRPQLFHSLSTTDVSDRKKISLHDAAHSEFAQDIVNEYKKKTDKSKNVATKAEPDRTTKNAIKSSTRPKSSPVSSHFKSSVEQFDQDGIGLFNRPKSSAKYSHVKPRISSWSTKSPKKKKGKNSKNIRVQDKKEPIEPTDTKPVKRRKSGKASQLRIVINKEENSSITDVSSIQSDDELQENPQSLHIAKLKETVNDDSININSEQGDISSGESGEFPQTEDEENGESAEEQNIQPAENTEQVERNDEDHITSANCSNDMVEPSEAATDAPLTKITIAMPIVLMDEGEE